jgi:hypothetical protein
MLTSDPPPEKPVAYCAIGEKSLAMWTLRFKGEEFSEMYESQFVKEGEIHLFGPFSFPLPPFEFSFDRPRYDAPGAFMLGSIGRLYDSAVLSWNDINNVYSFLDGGY